MHALEIRSDQKNHLGCGTGGVLINERRGSGCGVYPCCSFYITILVIIINFYAHKVAINCCVCKKHC